MINDKRVLGIIPARGGSKGVPRKNIRLIGGRPLIAWTVEEAKKSAYIDRLILSSEDPEIIGVARSLGCDVPFVRPLELASDKTPGIEPVLHAIDMLPGYQIAVLLQVTSPQRRVADIDGCLVRLVEGGACACVSVTPAKENPYWMYTLRERGMLEPLFPAENIVRRQDLPNAYVLNGAVYAAYCDWLRKEKTFLTNKTVGFVMPQERSIDIDTEDDMQSFARSFGIFQ